MTGSKGEHAKSESAATDTTVAQSEVDRFVEIWRIAVLAAAFAILVVALVVDINPVVRFGIGGVVFVLWWFVSTGVAVFDRLGE